MGAHLYLKKVALKPDPVLPRVVLPDNVLVEKLGVEMASQAELRSPIFAFDVDQRHKDVDTVSWGDGGGCTLLVRN